MGKPIHHTDWLLILFFINGLLFLFAKLYHSKKFAVFISLPFNSGLQDFEKEFNPYGVKDLFDIALSINSFLIYSSGLYIIFNPDLSLWSDFFRMLFILILFFLVKNFIGLFVAWLFGKNEEVTVSHNANLAYRIWASIWVYPLLVFLVFVPFLKGNSSILAAIILSLGYALSMSVGILRLWSISASKYYKIFYLCTLEIGPLVILIFWLKNH